MMHTRTKPNVVYQTKLRPECDQADFELDIRGFPSTVLGAYRCLRVVPCGEVHVWASRRDESMLNQSSHAKSTPTCYAAMLLCQNSYQNAHTSLLDRTASRRTHEAPCLRACGYRCFRAMRAAKFTFVPKAMTTESRRRTSRLRYSAWVTIPDPRSQTRLLRN
ncbi:hypothetical protein JAAARDRAFT_390080 [Jaapia argillacea MUCL 33604]|uniref:Uncharacterized protein n=1 Tax=Jaapia argillacea MUCL 33604 TaxID=933084 RepID=A0A067QJP8_9AGAM|nr:hypothetical protein JAAARDRAFT_390080 [Jaapia argillacea MUCL 33604]